MLEVKNITLSYDFKEHFNKKAKKLTILNDISFSLESGENLSILGVSGSGKSSLARVIAGLIKPQSGTILLNGKSLNFDNFKEFSKISLLMQNQKSCLNPALKIKTSLKLLEKYQNTKFIGILDSLKSLNLSKNTLDKYPHELSGGEASRVGILKSLLIKSEILILDEITSGLDDDNIAQLLELIKGIKTSIIFITHDLNLAQKVSKNFIIIESANLVTYGKFSDMQNDEIVKKYQNI
ncbi:ATP-binding cassette domain-containing protein [Campylobacter corcagiensis]|uniref:ATP-binding cassette domain-containing protein n=1 Tax=Campylobacter corcagiensis TaxID=1448857 RepID=A0A7M1LHZ9_9BACT|nr:ATP-binding cassette domain-containing protein [Campylobacter corcagiensis]QKF65351.1 nickel ABC transporter, ATP-binding protein [Campylobacter corcagiensis]QOQ88070.1 ATP-binding cassette domain-containing protein [Campylobacter corcagiensis]